jgi:hypothetical protein
MPEEITRACEGWTSIVPSEQRNRLRQYEVSGFGCLRALFILPPRHPDTLRLRQREEEEQQMREDTPDFAGMLREGMTVSEREEQLMYDTTDIGEVLFEDTPHGPQKRPRRSYDVRNFACDPEGHIGLERSSLFWQPEKIIKHILKEELKQGLIVKDGDTAQKPPTKTKTARTKEIHDMPAGNKVIISRGGKKAVSNKGKPIAKGKASVPAKAGGAGKVAAPPKRTAAKGRVATKPGATKPAPAGDSGAAFNVEELSQTILEGMRSMVAEMVTESKNEILSSMVGQFRNQLEAVTSLHDMMVDSAAIECFMTHVPQRDDEGEILYDEEGNILTDELVTLSDHPNLLLAYVYGGEDPDEEGNGEEGEEE